MVAVRAGTPRPADAPSFAVVGARILPGPGRPPIPNGTVLVRGARIVAVGPGLVVPSTCRTFDARGATVTAGFWNAHVHFTEPRWPAAIHGPPEPLAEGLEQMLTRHGFTSVVDCGSDPRVTVALRRRIESGEIAGPRVLTAGPGIFPPHGLPYYLKGSLPLLARWLAPTPGSPAAAVRVVRRHLGLGADLIKLFTGSYTEPGRVLPMPEDVARAAVDEAHSAGRLVFAHPSDRAGVLVALRSGVDVLAHAPDSSAGVDRALVRQLVARGLDLIPTLLMFEATVSGSAAYLEPIRQVVREFHASGGRLLFGTDVGYLPEDATEGEFRSLARCGLDAEDVLSMLTTAPAARMTGGQERGTVEAGERADLAILEGDPTGDLAGFARVRATVRGGQVLWSA